MDPLHFEHYRETVQELAEQSERDPQKLNELLALIEKKGEENSQNPYDVEFFKGEYDFYSKNYERALKHYLEARTTQHFEFYCYRASAFISDARGQLDKAKAFAKKALAIYPEDYFSLSLLTSNDSHFTLNQEESQPQVNLGSQEQEELSEIFEESSEKENSFNEGFHPKTLEPTMNTDASLFSFPKSQDPATTAKLTQRLYPLDQENFPYHASENTLEEIRKELWESQESQNPLTETQEIENAIAAFHRTQSEKMRHYRDRIKQRTSFPDFCFYILHGYQEETAADPLYLTEDSRKATGGYFFRWNQKGVVINPGRNFMDHFHASGLNIQDIDFVIVTQDNPECYADIQEIYDLNYQMNRKNNQNLQIIHYYLIQNAYQELSRKLKPNFRQERHTVHHMDLFLDSPEIERIDLSPEICLHYFPASSLGALAQSYPSNQEKVSKSPSSLGLRLELRFPHEKKSLSIGYLSGTSWTPLIGHYLGRCDLLIAGMGNTQPNDYHKASYMEECLGYFGCYSLIEELEPRLTICTEFGGRDGDIRLELLKKLKSDLSHKQTTLLPGDLGLLLDLHHLQIKCSISEAFVNPSDIHIAKSGFAFGKLHYLASNCFL